MYDVNFRIQTCSSVLANETKIMYAVTCSLRKLNIFKLGDINKLSFP